MLLVAMRNVSENSYSLELSENFCHMQTDRRFVKIVKSHSGHPKMNQNRKSKIFTIYIYIYIYTTVGLENIALVLK